MIKEGKKIVVLAAGEPDFDTPDIIKEAAIKAIKDGFTKYTPSGGTVTLKQAICKKFKKDNGLDYTPEEIIVSNGAKHCLYNIFQVICNEGDEVIIIHPYWLSYHEMVKLAGATPVFLATRRENGFRSTAEEIKSAITSKTKAIIINSPSNPAGVVYNKKELMAIADVCLKHNVTIISDEIYEKIVFDAAEHVSIASLSPEIFRKTIVVNGVSKSYSMTGWRIGYAAGDKAIISKMNTLQDHSTSNPCSISQYATEFALNANLDGVIADHCAGFQKKRDIMINALSGEKKISPFKPQGAFYLFCDISKTGMNSMTFAKRLLEEKHVAVIPGGPFGDDKYVRMSFATSIDNIEDGTKRIKEWLN